MTYLRMLAAAAAVVFGLGLASAASAAPLAPIAADTVAGAAQVTDVALGCGRGFTRNRFGRCRPFFGPRVYGPRRFYGRRFFHHRRFFRHYRFHGRRHFHGHHRFHRR